MNPPALRPPSQGRAPRRQAGPRLVLACAFVLLVSAGILAGPRLISLAYLVRGGKILDQARAAHGAATGPGLCPIPADKDTAASLEQASKLLKQAVRYQKDHSQAYLLLGRVSCLRGDFQEALKAYTTYSYLRPGNPLGFIGAGLALLASGEPGPAAKKLAQAGVTPGQVVAAGDDAVLSQDFALAYKLYTLAETAQPGIVQPPASMYWVVAAAVTRQSLPASVSTPALQIHPLDGSVQVPAIDLQWETDGKRLGDTPGGDPSVGVMWFGSHAITLIDAGEAGDYRFVLRALNNTPAPVILELTADYASLGQFSLSKGDGSWEDLAATARLSAGLHLVGVRFLNDGLVDGVDRNAVLAWLQLTRVSTEAPE